MNMWHEGYKCARQTDPISPSFDVSGNKFNFLFMLLNCVYNWWHLHYCEQEKFCSNFAEFQLKLNLHYTKFKRPTITCIVPGNTFFPVTVTPQMSWYPRTFFLIILVQARWLWGEFSDLYNKKGQWNLYKNFGQSLAYPKLLLNIKCISREHICERSACERFHRDDDAVCPR